MAEHVLSIIDFCHDRACVVYYRFFYDRACFVYYRFFHDRACVVYHRFFKLSNFIVLVSNKRDLPIYVIMVCSHTC